MDSVAHSGFFCFHASNWCGPIKTPEQPEYASMLQLVVTPERFDGKLVSVIGFLYLGKEADELAHNFL